MKSVLKTFESIDLFSWVQKITMKNRLFLVDKNNQVLKKDERARQFFISIHLIKGDLIYKFFKITKDN